MDFKPFLHLVPYVAASFVFFLAFWGMIDMLSAITSHFQDWLRAKRNINTEVPALTASVKELRDRQTRLEREMEKVKAERPR